MLIVLFDLNETVTIQVEFVKTVSQNDKYVYASLLKVVHNRKEIVWHIWAHFYSFSFKNNWVNENTMLYIKQGVLDNILLHLQIWYLTSYCNCTRNAISLCVWKHILDSLYFLKSFNVSLANAEIFLMNILWYITAITENLPFICK